MEAFAAISFAGNVVQFVQIGMQVVRQSTEILQSASGVTVAVNNLLDTVQSLRRLSHELTSISPPDPSKPETFEEQELRTIAAGCRDAADRLLSTLTKLRGRSSNSKWNAVTRAARTMLKKKEIDEMSATLDEFRMQISFCILNILK